MPTLFDIPIDSECRHIISFRSWSGEIKVSDKLKQFYKFIYNPDARRVSFVTEKNTNFNKLLTDKLFPTEIFPIDPGIKTFNDEFLKTNPQIDFKLIQTFDMIADPADTKIWNQFNKQIPVSELTTPFYFAGGLFALWLMKKK